MDYILRCNDLKCRKQLYDQAVVTTCSHVFCTQCADTSGLSRAHNANRQCPACGTQLVNPDDVVVQGLNPSEDYKTSVLSGLSPTIIMEVASRGLAFYSYQASQEIIYQEHLAKSLTEKYANLNQQMDQLIHDANSQIKGLQDRMQGMQVEQADLVHKNDELAKAYGEKSRMHAQTQKLYQSLKARVMASHVANAAGDEADFALQTARGSRFVDKLPGTRSSTANLGQFGVAQQQMEGKRHRRNGSGSSGSGGQPRGGINLGPAWKSQMQGQVSGSGGYTGQSAPVGTPSQLQGHRSRLPVLGGGGQQHAFSNADNGVSYQPSPMQGSQQLGGVGPRNLGGFGFGAKGAKRPGVGPVNALLRG